MEPDKSKDPILECLGLEKALKNNDYAQAFEHLWLMIAPVVEDIAKPVPGSGYKGIQLPIEIPGLYYLTSRGELLYIYPDGERTKLTPAQAIERTKDAREFFQALIDQIDLRIELQAREHSERATQLNWRRLFLRRAKVWLLPAQSVDT